VSCYPPLLGVFPLQPAQEYSGGPHVPHVEPRTFLGERLGKPFLEFRFSLSTFFSFLVVMTFLVALRFIRSSGTGGPDPHSVNSTRSFFPRLDFPELAGVYLRPNLFHGALTL